MAERASLLAAARLSAMSNTRVALAHLAQAVAVVAAQAPEGLFDEHLDRLERLLHEPSTFSTSLWMLANTNMIRYTVRDHNLQDALAHHLDVVAAADDELRRCEQTAASYDKAVIGASGELVASGALPFDVLELAARLRLGVWRQSPLMADVTVKDLLRCDHTVTSHLAAIADCSEALIVALAHLSAQDAIAASVAVSV